MPYIFQEHHVIEEIEGQPASMNAFELISMNKGLNLDNFFESDKVRIFQFQLQKCVSWISLYRLYNVFYYTHFLQNSLKCVIVLMSSILLISDRSTSEKHDLHHNVEVHMLIYITVYWSIFIMLVWLCPTGCFCEVLSKLLVEVAVPLVAILKLLSLFVN